jgi:DNA polymerase III subunit delta
MYKRDFDQHLARNSFSNALMFFGESHFFIDRYTALLSNIPDASKLVFYHDEYNFSTAQAHLSQASLFGDANLLVIKTEKKVPKADLDKLIELCKKNPDNRFIYAYYGNDYKTSDKSFKDGAMSVRFFTPNHTEAITFLHEEAQKIPLVIDKYTLNHLLAIQNGDISLAASELSKLALFNREISIKDIDTLVFGVAQLSLDQLITKILSKHDLKKTLEQILQTGEDEIKIITTLSSFVTQLYLFNTYIRINGAPDSQAILGYMLPQFILAERANFSLKFKPSQYKAILEHLLNCELKLKSANTNKEAILFSTLLKLQKII